MSAGGNSSKSKSTSVSQSEASSFIDPTQSGFLQNLWGQAQQFANPMAAQQAAQGATDVVNPMLQGAMTSMAGLMDPTSQIAAQTASLQSGLGQMFREEINPAIEGAAIGAGGYGGSRQGVAQGVATGQLGQAFTQGLGDIVASANQTSMGAAGMMPGLGQAFQMSSMSPSMAGMGNLQQLAGILGGPTVLNEATSGTISKSKGKSGGFSFGLS